MTSARDPRRDPQPGDVLRKCTCKHLEAAHCKYYGCTQCRCRRFRQAKEAEVVNA